MKPGDELELTVESLDLLGRGVATSGTTRVTVVGSIPGERVRAKVISARPGQVQAEVAEVMAASPQRVTPRCRHAAACGNCSFQHIRYPEQLRLKADLLRRLLAATLGAKVVIDPPIGMSTQSDSMPWGFRHKVSFVFGQGKGAAGIAMGHFARDSSSVLAIKECPVHSEAGNQIAFGLRDHLRPALLAGAGSVLRRVIVRTTVDQRQAAALLVATHNDKRLRTPIKAWLKSELAPDSFALSEQDRPDTDGPGADSIRLHGKGSVRERALGPVFQLSPDAFFQTNPEAARILVKLVLEATATPTGQRVLDLYAGSGLFSQPLALAGHRVIAVEENRRAVSDGEENRRLNHIDEGRLRFITERVENVLPRLSKYRFDAVVLDPPRSGCPLRTLQAIATGLMPARMVHISCNPEALAAELPVLIGSGYHIDRIQPVDMFPHTPHIETVTILTRGMPSAEAGATDAGGRAKHPR